MQTLINFITVCTAWGIANLIQGLIWIVLVSVVIGIFTLGGLVWQFIQSNKVVSIIAISLIALWVIGDFVGHNWTWISEILQI